MRKRGEPFSKGDKINGKTVLELGANTQRLRKRKYVVLHEVCGCVTNVTHGAFMHRSTNPGVCGDCNRAQQGKKTGAENIRAGMEKQKIRITHPRGSHAWAHKYLGLAVPSLAMDYPVWR